MALTFETTQKELEKAQEAYVKALGEKLDAELNRKTVFEDCKNVVASKPVDGKAPSESSCERQARCDARYLKACAQEIEAIKKFETAKCAMEVVQYKAEASIALLKP